jgi:hypothetical protein
MKQKSNYNAPPLIALAAIGLLCVANGAETYFPLKEGGTWEYGLTMSKGGTASESLTAVSKNLPRRDLKGIKVTPRTIEVNAESGLGSATSFSFCAEDVNGVYELGEQKADSVEPTIHAAPRYFLKYPLKVGTRWTTGAETAILGVAHPVTLTNTIESISEVVTTPAGTFEGCVKVRGVGRTISTKEGDGTSSQIDVEDCCWYAPGVGLVQEADSEKNNGHYRIIYAPGAAGSLQEAGSEKNDGHNDLPESQFVTSGKATLRLKAFKK